MSISDPQRNKPHVIVGNTDFDKAHMWTRLGRTVGGDRQREVGLDLNATTCGALLGDQGSGKSYNLGNIVEAFTTQIPGANFLPKPGCALVFHYSNSQDYKPEVTLMNRANENPKEIELLQKWGITPTGCKDVVVVCPQSQVAARRVEFPHLTIVPLLFHEEEVAVDSYINLMGDAASESFEIEVLMETMEELRDRLTVDNIEKAIAENKYLTEMQKNLLFLKIRKAKKFITTDQRIATVFRPGRVVVVDLRDEFMPKSTAFRLLLCLLNVFQNVTYGGSIFPKVLVADEAHEYADDAFLCANLVRCVRLMRHKSLTILVASQDPPSLPRKLLELISWSIMLNMGTKKWVEYMADCKAPIGKVDASLFCGLPSGTGWLWGRNCSDPLFQDAPQKIIFRPRATMHGGFTKSAIQ